MRKGSSNPTVSSLRAGNAQGGLRAPDYELLRGNLQLQSLAAHKILDAHFPASIHDEIVRFFGLTLDDPHAGDKTSELVFRERVLLAYEARCALTGFALNVNERTIGVEAAHIFWPQSGGNDETSNGVAMTTLHRKLFHLGLFAIQPSFKIEVASEVKDGGESRISLSRLAGRSITLPTSKVDWPNQDALAWHRQWVFRG